LTNGVKNMSSPEAVFLRGSSIVLTPLGATDVSESYLAWLNDPEVLRYRGPKAFPTTMAQLKTWIDELPNRGDLVLAIRTVEGQRHIGNLALNAISSIHRNADLAIMIGAKNVWGRGYGAEAIELVTQHAFRAMGLHRLSAQSPNPSFNAAVRKLGWNQEGVRREDFLLDGSFVDVECWGLLSRDWQKAQGR
jgi:RimJ/RimL family protein N-acetyltransferase